MFNNVEKETFASAAWEIINEIKADFKSGHEFVTRVTASYMLFRSATEGKDIKYADFAYGKVSMPGNVAQLIPNILSEGMWTKLLKLRPKYNADVFASLVVSNYFSQDLGYGENQSTPESICDLSLEILDIKNGDSIMDLGCGGANIYVSAADVKDIDVCYYGYDINTACAEIAAMRLDILGGEARVHQCDFFALADADAKKLLPKVKSRKVFANFPFGVRFREDSCRFLSEIKADCPAFGGVNSDWVYAELICRLMGEKGKGVGIFTNGSLNNSSSTLIRKYFIERGLVEAVVSLPGKMFDATAIPTTIVVFCHDNKTVKFVNASEMFEAGRRRNSFSEENVKSIINLLNNGGDHSVELSVEKIAANDYQLSPVQYTEFHEEDGVQFNDIILKSTRGAPITAKDLDAMTSLAPTDYQYLMLANIKDGVISGELPYLKSIDASMEKFCIKDNALVISKNGYPFKVAVARVEDGKKLLANGNLFVIELDETKADPTYVKAYFESSVGIAALKRITTGNAIPMISIEALKRIRIPLPTLARQREFVSRYQEATKRVENLRKQLAEALDGLSVMFEAEVKA